MYLGLLSLWTRLVGLGVIINRARGDILTPIIGRVLTVVDLIIIQQEEILILTQEEGAI